MMENIARANAADEMRGQYSLAKILGIWALAAIPMGILSWIVFPALSPDAGSDPLGAGVTRIGLLTVGLIWLFVLSMIIVRQEEGDLRWATIKRRLWLNAPRDPKTGETRRRLWLWVIPFLIAIVVFELALKSYVDGLWVSIFPFFAEPPGYSMAAVFESREILDRLVGAWWFLGLYVVNAVFNTILGEEFLFRGVLLPKMKGVFGRWSWVGWRTDCCMASTIFTSPGVSRRLSLVVSSSTPFRAGASAASGWASSSTLRKARTLLS
jgi:membrane protease YdiL (CAAX protease family)